MVPGTASHIELPLERVVTAFPSPMPMLCFICSFRATHNPAESVTVSQVDLEPAQQLLDGRGRGDPGTAALLRKAHAVLRRASMSVLPASQVQEQGFRPSKLRVDAAIRTVSLVLCNDKLTTYGAPDVLQVSVDQLEGHYYRNACFADRPPNQVRPCAKSVPSICQREQGIHCYYLRDLMQSSQRVRQPFTALWGVIDRCTMWQRQATGPSCCARLHRILSRLRGGSEAVCWRMCRRGG